MLKAKLLYPVYLVSQADEIAERFAKNGIAIDKERILDIITGVCGVRGLSEFVSVADNGKQLYHTKPADKLHLEEDECYIGADAIAFLFRLTNTDDKGLQPVDEIDIKYDVFMETNRILWYDISLLFSRVVIRNERIERMHLLEAPFIIMMNEYRILASAVNQLENNHTEEPYFKMMTYDDGKAVRSLSDIGYSLLTGWNEQMRAYFEEQDAGQNDIDDVNCEEEKEDEDGEKA